MANYALQSDIYDVEDIQPAGAGTWNDELTTATRDVLVLIKSEFWAPRSIVSFDEAKLDTTALLKLTVYRALGWYICPSLDTFKEGEDTAWTRKTAHYRMMFKEEWKIVQQMPIYDFNDNDVFEDTETQGLTAIRWGRG